MYKLVKGLPADQSGKICQGDKILQVSAMCVYMYVVDKIQ